MVAFSTLHILLIALHHVPVPVSLYPLSPCIRTRGPRTHAPSTYAPLPIDHVLPINAVLGCPRPDYVLFVPAIFLKKENCVKKQLLKL